MRTFSVKNFERFQHYKDRSPPWIKLYNELLDDYAFSTLTDASKFHLVAIWLLASRTENKIPHDPVWIAARINAKNRVDLDALEKAGFIVVSQDAPNKADGVAQDASKTLDQRERRVEAEQSRAETDGARDSEFEAVWETYPRKVGKGQARKAFRTARAKADLSAIVDGIRRMDRSLEERFIPHMATWLSGERWLDASGVSKPNGRGPPKSERETWADRLAAYKPGKYWSSNWGARPESGYCDAPADLLGAWREQQGLQACPPYPLRRRTRAQHDDPA